MGADVQGGVVTQSFYLPIVGPSLNAWYSGSHWATRKRIAGQWHMMVKLWVKKYGIVPAKGLVSLEIECSFGPGRKSYDASNCAATAKLIEDGLVKAKILKGDGPQYVASITLRSIPKQKITGTMVTIEEVESR